MKEDRAHKFAGQTRWIGITAVCRHTVAGLASNGRVTWTLVVRGEGRASERGAGGVGNATFFQFT